MRRRRNSGHVPQGLEQFQQLQMQQGPTEDGSYFDGGGNFEPNDGFNGWGTDTADGAGQLPKRRPKSASQSRRKPGGAGSNRRRPISAGRQDRGLALGSGIERASSPPPSAGSTRSDSKLKNLPAERRAIARLRFKKAQKEVLRMKKTVQQFDDVSRAKRVARSRWQKGVKKVSSMLNFMKSSSVRKRKRSLFGNVLSGEGKFTDLGSLPKIHIERRQVGIAEIANTKRLVGRLTQEAGVEGSGAHAMVLHQRSKRPSSPVTRPKSPTKRKSDVVATVEKAPAEDGEERRSSLSKVKSAVGKLKKYIRVVRLSYSFDQEAKQMSVNEILAKLRQHYDPDGIHSHTEDQHHFYTDIALLQRESLKYDPKVRQVLDYIWEATDRDGNGEIDKAEYMEMCKKVYRAVVDDSDDPETEEERKRIAEEDWDADRLGHDFLDYDRFTRAWFQLADHWTHDLTTESYVNFLTEIFETITTKDSNGHIVWRDDKAIHHYDPDATAEERQIMVEQHFDEKPPPPKKPKRRRGSVMMDPNVMKFLNRMGTRGSGHASAVVAVQEGEVDRDIRHAKVRSRNGLYLGSTIPPPQGWEEQGASQLGASFVRIEIGRKDDEEHILAQGRTMAGQTGRSGRSGRADPPLPQSEIETVLQELRSTSPWKLRNTGSSPGGPGGWLVKFTRGSLSDQRHTPIRLQTGAGGGFGVAEQGPEIGSSTESGLEDDSFNTGGSFLQGSSIDSLSRADQTTNIDEEREALLQHYPEELQSNLGVHRQGKPRRKKRRKKKKKKKKKKTTRPHRLRPLTADESLHDKREETLENRPQTAPSSEDGKGLKKGRHRARQRQRKRRPRTASSTRMRQRRHESDGRGGDASDMHPSNRPSTAPVGSKARGLTRMDSGRLFQSRPESAQVHREISSAEAQKLLPRAARTLLKGSDATSRHSSSGTLRKINMRRGRRKDRVNQTSAAVPPRKRTIRLLHLSAGSTKEDVLSVFQAWGLQVSAGDIRMGSIDPVGDTRSARVRFLRYTDFREAVSMLEIVNRAGKTGARLFEALPEPTSDYATEATPVGSQRGAGVETKPVARIRVPALLRRKAAV